MAITRETAGLEIELICESEDVSPRGYFASGDDAMDREDEQAILSRLERGDDWAWFCAHVRVTYNGESADDYLGACSYANEKDFRADGMDDMVDTCLAELNKRMDRAQSLRIGAICFDRDAKDIVKITNGTDAGGWFVPTEAIALRVVGYRTTRKGVYPRIAFTYRKVNADSLDVRSGDTEPFTTYFSTMAPKFNAGRV